MEEDSDVDIIEDFDSDIFLSSLNEINFPLDEEISSCVTSDDFSQSGHHKHSDIISKNGNNRLSSKYKNILHHKLKNQPKQNKETSENLAHIIPASCAGNDLNLAVNKRKRKNTSHSITRKTKSSQCIRNERVLTLNCNSIFTGENEEVIRLTKIDDSLDDEVEIDIEEGQDFTSTVFKPPILLPKPASRTTYIHTPNSGLTESFKKKLSELPPMQSKYMLGLQERLKNVYSLPQPDKEIILDLEKTTSEEIELFPEFFNGSKSSLIERYLTIRSHIINCWKSKQSLYLTKTQARAGLKNCGDVNLISRIHAYLEMKGAINFGCEQCYYVQKLKNYQNINNTVEENDDSKEYYNKSWATTVVDKDWNEIKDNISPAIDYGEGGLTLVHGNNGTVADIVVSRQTTEVKAKEKAKRKRNRSSSCEEELIYCKRFSLEKPAPFCVLFSLESLLVAEIHSFSSPWSTALGLFTGTYDINNQLLYITNCTPIAISGLTICNWNSAPKSEQMKERTVLGWYFSCPVTNSDSSIIRQPLHSDLQALFTKNNSKKPFIMLVLSPYSRARNRCITTLENYPHLIDYKIKYEDKMIVSDTLRQMNEAKQQGDGTNWTKTICEQLNNKTYGQLCYESIRRLLDSTSNCMPSDVKTEIILGTKTLVRFNKSMM